MRRRQFLESALAATPLLAQHCAAKIDESDPTNANLCHRLDANSVSDDDPRFLEQIGLSWVRLEFGEGEVTLDTLRTQQRRFARFKMRIYSGVHYAYRSPRVQLGEPGRDQDIEIYRRFLHHAPEPHTLSRACAPCCGGPTKKSVSIQEKEHG
jgi:hypothetical protein